MRCIMVQSYDQSHFLVRYVAGLSAGLTSATIFHPVDTFRIVSFYNTSRIRALSDLVKWNNFKSLYNGIFFNLGATSIKSIVTYPTQDMIRDKLLKYDWPIYKAETGASILTGFLLGIVTTPINAIKVPLQSNSVKGTMRSVIATIYMTHGLKGFYNGGVATFLRDISFNCVYFPTYRYFNRKTDHKIASSLIAGIASMTVAYPFDGTRLYLQKEGSFFNFWYGFSRSFDRSRMNLASYITSVIRVPLSSTIAHMTYLFTVKILTSC